MSALLTNPHFSSARTGGSDCWATPLSIVDALERDFGLRFVLDVACETHNAIVGGVRGDREGFALRLDHGLNGLQAPWARNVRTVELAGCHRNRATGEPLGRAAVWCNPPYSSVDQWIAKCAREGQHVPVAALVPVRSDRPWWRDFILPRYGEKAREHAEAVLFIEGRIRFVGASNDASFPSVIALWGVDGPYEVSTWCPSASVQVGLGV